MIEGKHMQRGFVSQLTSGTSVVPALTELYTHGVSRNVIMPKGKGRYGIKKGQKHVYAICESSLSKLSLLVKSIVLYLLT